MVTIDFILGIVLGAIFGSILFVFIMHYKFKRRKKNNIKKKSINKRKIISMDKSRQCKTPNPWNFAINSKPQDCSSVMLVSKEGVFLVLGKYIEDENRVINGNSMFFIYDNYMWAYLEDLLPNKD